MEHKSLTDDANCIIIDSYFHRSIYDYEHRCRELLWMVEGYKDKYVVNGHDLMFADIGNPDQYAMWCKTSDYTVCVQRLGPDDAYNPARVTWIHFDGHFYFKPDEDVRFYSGNVVRRADASHKKLLADFNAVVRYAALGMAASRSIM